MKIHMLETRRGSEDGFAVRCFLKDMSYDIADTLARAFIQCGWAVEVGEIPQSLLKDNHHDE